MSKKDACKVFLIAMAAVLWGNNSLVIRATEIETEIEIEAETETETETEKKYQILEESKKQDMESVVVGQKDDDTKTSRDELDLESEMIKEGESEERPEDTLSDHEVPGLDEYRDSKKTDSVDKYGEAVLINDGTVEDSGEDDFYYTGPLDGRTGKPITSNVTNKGGGVYIMGKDDYNFDSKTGRYEILCGEMSVGCDVPPESLLSYGEKFNIYVPMGIMVTIYYNGELLENQNTTQFSKSGIYTFQIETPYATDGKRIVNVTILRKKVNNINRIILPEGFEFSSVKVDGEATTLTSKNVYECYREGKYEVSWECTEVGESFYTTFELDTTAPTLALPEVIDGQAKKPVTLTDMSGDTYVVYETESGRVVITDNTKTIDVPGKYVLLACDEAGNYTRYDFTLHTYLNSSAFSAILLVVVGIVALFFYCRRLRHHMRVG